MVAATNEMVVDLWVPAGSKMDLDLHPEGFLECDMRALQSSRLNLLMLMSSAIAFCDVNKVNISMAVIPVALELDWSATKPGLVSSAFFLAMLWRRS